MSNIIKIFGGKVLSQGSIVGSTVVMRDGKIDYVGYDNTDVPTGSVVIDACGKYVSAGFIDMHTHGAGGSDFMDSSVTAYQTAARMHATHGTTLLYPTTLTSTNELLYETFDIYKRAKAEITDGAALGGLHLEGPYFAYEQRGAQDPRYLRNPEPKEYMEILSHTNDIARWSLAPELQGAPAMGKELAKRGILAAIGHTNATFEECDEAFRNGFSHMTHFYSCMSTVTRRNAFRYAGVIEYGYYNDQMTIEIIGDGIHVPQSLLNLVFKIKGVDNIALVTDSMRGAGMPNGNYLLGGLNDGQEVVVEDGVAKLLDRSAFAGSVATTDRLVRTVHTLTGRSIAEIVRCVTDIPARIMGVDRSKGSIQSGKDADIVIFDDNITIDTTIVGGKVIYTNNHNK